MPRGIPARRGSSGASTSIDEQRHATARDEGPWSGDAGRTGDASFGPPRPHLISPDPDPSTDPARNLDLLRATVESSPDGVIVMVAGGTSLFANTTFLETWGISAHVAESGEPWLLAQAMTAQLTEPAAFLEEIRRCFSSGVGSTGTVGRLDGRVLEWVSTPLEVRGTLLGLAWRFRDVTDRVDIEHDLRLAEAKYRTLVEQIPAVTYTAAFGIEAWTYVSPHIETILGYAPDEWMADAEIWYQRIHPDDREAAMEAERRTERTGARLSCEYRMLARDGRIVWIRDEGVVVQVGGQRVLQGIMFDITERKRAEDELERALQREREAAQRLRSLDEMKNTFLHAVSHELRTPLSAVLGFALTLEREDLELPPDERAEILHRIATNARKLDHLLSDLLDLDRLDRGIVEPRRRLTDLTSLIGRTVANSGIRESRRVEVDVAPIEAMLDGPKVERMVENLLVNAARHTPANAAIWVRAHRENGGLVVAVEDEGDGVPSDIREAIFEPFRQGPEAPQHAPGVGIGLSLVARFAELHGGRAWCEERQGGGASFRIYLPDEPAAP